MALAIGKEALELAKKIDYTFTDLTYLETGKPEFHGEYMMQYSWAEETSALL